MQLWVSGHDCDGFLTGERLIGSLSAEWLNGFIQPYRKGDYSIAVVARPTSCYIGMTACRISRC